VLRGELSNNVAPVITENAMAEDAEDNAGTRTAPSTVEPSPHEQTSQEEASQEQGSQEQTAQQSDVLPTDSELLSSDLLHAAHVLPADMVANVELTLDHLSESVDLFDIPPFDYGDTGGGDPG
jgi:hypothetical protein